MKIGLKIYVQLSENCERVSDFQIIGEKVTSAPAALVSSGI